MSIENPMPQDFLRICLEKRVLVQLIEGRKLSGVFHAYDEHCNVLLSDVVETLLIPSPDGTLEPCTRNLDLLFVRGDRIMTISPVK